MKNQPKIVYWNFSSPAFRSRGKNAEKVDGASNGRAVAGGRLILEPPLKIVAADVNRP
jgi:hypothetical protein